MTMPTLGHQPAHHYDPWGRTPDQVRLEVMAEYLIDHVGTDQQREIREQVEVEAFCVSGLGHQVERREEDDQGRVHWVCSACDTDMEALFDLNPEEP